MINMNYKKKLPKLFFSITSFLVLFTFFSIPSDIHFQLCFGDDGHFDLKSNICNIEQKHSQQKNYEKLSNQNHHKDCLDVVVGCLILDEFNYQRNLTRVGNIKDQKNNYLKFDCGRIPFSALHDENPASNTHVPLDGLISSPNLLSQRTIILLV